ncbi:hypothetical protein F511_42968 [Dorcoceras hygrometricum]|uniref:Uncharacterized protein n=1 Tax=Dorcoceras hygrometricum TaxID=472368 RepID=A0A2Z7ACD4_9LAMI|nr:hypothetical protein F511_42968 [Dorcoceras hygrometricum]
MKKAAGALSVDVISSDITISRKKNPVASYYARKAKVAQLDNHTQATAHPVESFYEPAVALYIQSQDNSAEAQSSSRHGSASKQLTIYESWMSTAELNSNGKNAQDGKNQWLRFSRANYLNSGEQDLYYSGK